jgi:hypothetical protein
VQLHPYDKKAKFSTIALGGYLVDAFYKFNDYNNRIYMNPILLDSRNSYNNFISCLQYNYVGLFDAISDFIETLNLLASGIELYKTLNLVNLTDSSVSTYVDNIEINLPPIPTPLININTIITSLDLGTINDNQDLTIFTDLKAINPGLTDEIITHLEIINKDNTSCIVKVVQGDVIYYGSVNIVYKLPSYSFLICSRLNETDFQMNIITTDLTNYNNTIATSYPYTPGTYFNSY